MHPVVAVNKNGCNSANAKKKKDPRNESLRDDNAAHMAFSNIGFRRTSFCVVLGYTKVSVHRGCVYKSLEGFC